VNRPLTAQELIASGGGELEGRCGACKVVMPLAAGGKTPPHAVDGVWCDGSHDYAVQHVQRIAPPAVVPAEGCIHCGVAERAHAQRWVEGVGWHAWRAPSTELIEARMRARHEMKET
jgi:hypothetical protein